MSIRVYPAFMQGKGEFDGGKITEQKPIGFPGEGSVINRIGPLYYWAWAKAPVGGHIAPHQHEGYEIVTYVTQGTAVHRDSLGSDSRVAQGGLQIMHTGSGVSHEEEWTGPDMESFQIWLEPDLTEAWERTPKYMKYEANEFPLAYEDGVVIRTLIGTGSPAALTVDAQLQDIELKSGKSFVKELDSGRTAAVLILEGAARFLIPGSGEMQAHAGTGDFVMLTSPASSGWAVTAAEDALRLLVIEVPNKVNYRLTPKKY
ncbi:pirin family protein [Paenibacillus sp. JX-17]|uniref:Pirin family protein n=1 Tax=Paenibacillus lacisoli TaxID=3064525 RepID=A0ABT9CAM7_9BACL|nr:pirin family protein [Paenibacillus sp. JX-17]MDO7905709.1 pirin family protein [Paenibacillus sp. JX-17]